MLGAGLEAALKWIRDFHYSQEDLEFLSKISDYEPEFLDFLSKLRFTGDILAMPEGTIAFPNEPLLRVTAPFCEALIIESGVLQAINLATLIATKAARIVYAAQGRRISEFALRRAQNPYVVARSSYIGGCWSTSFLAAAYELRLPATGTVPHALIQLFDTEEEAFNAIAETFNRYTLLLDTYDVHNAIHTAIKVANRSRAEWGHSLAAVRLDSGDFIADSQYVRKVLDDAGWNEVRILVSGDMDEYKIADLLKAGACIDAFGVGTALGAGAGSLEEGTEGGALGGVYKLVWMVDAEGQGVPRIKKAGEKSTWPGRKEVYRVGQFERDVVMLEEEEPPAGSVRLLKPIMQHGQVIPGSLPPLHEIREIADLQRSRLPDRWQALKVDEPYPVEFSPRLRAMRERLIQ